MFHFSRVPEHAAARKDNTLWGPAKPWERVGTDILMIKYEKFVVHCKLL